LFWQKIKKGGWIWFFFVFALNIFKKLQIFFPNWNDFSSKNTNTTFFGSEEVIMYVKKTRKFVAIWILRRNLFSKLTKTKNFLTNLINFTWNEINQILVINTIEVIWIYLFPNNFSLFLRMTKIDYLIRGYCISHKTFRDVKRWNIFSSLKYIEIFKNDSRSLHFGLIHHWINWKMFDLRSHERL